MTNFFTATLYALKLPLKLLTGWAKNKRRKKVENERAKKQLTHVRNFSVRHYSWQRSSGKKSPKKGTKKKLKK